jgi:malonyl-CoA/methylmalonyl-CoA synthetase
VNSLVSRAKNLIITGGFNVYPKEVETGIDAVPGVIECAVVGQPNEDFGEAVAAVVRPAPIIRAALRGFRLPARAARASKVA